MGKQTKTQELLNLTEARQERPSEERNERRLKTRINIPKMGLNLRNSHEIPKRQKVTRAQLHPLTRTQVASEG